MKFTIDLNKYTWQVGVKPNYGAEPYKIYYSQGTTRMSNRYIWGIGSVVAEVGDSINANLSAIRAEMHKMSKGDYPHNKVPFPSIGMLFTPKKNYEYKSIPLKNIEVKFMREGELPDYDIAIPYKRELIEYKQYIFTLGRKDVEGIIAPFGQTAIAIEKREAMSELERLISEKTTLESSTILDVMASATIDIDSLFYHWA